MSEWLSPLVHKYSWLFSICMGFVSRIAWNTNDDTYLIFHILSANESHL